MKTRPIISRQRGYLLLECLVYFAVLVVVLAVAMKGFYHCWTDTHALRRNADDIIRAVHAGEQWRADLRAANGPVQSMQADGNFVLRIPCPAGPVIYSYAKGELRRQTNVPAATHVLFTNIQSSRMESSARRRVKTI